MGEAIYRMRKGLSLRRLQGENHSFSPLQIDPEIKKVLSQKFTYLGRGRQCFAFESEDKKTVLKFPRTDIYRLPFYIRALASQDEQQKMLDEKNGRKAFIYDSFGLAQNELQEITGVLYTHLAPTEDTGDKLELIDSLGIKHLLPLNSSIFLIQEKHPLWTASFNLAKNKQEKDRILNALIDAIVKRAKKGILNRDRSFLKNYGFDGETVYQIDVGSFFTSNEYSQEQAYQKSARDSIEPVYQWLEKEDPEMLPLLTERLNRL